MLLAQQGRQTITITLGHGESAVTNLSKEAAQNGAQVSVNFSVVAFGLALGGLMSFFRAEKGEFHTEGTE